MAAAAACSGSDGGGPRASSAAEPLRGVLPLAHASDAGTPAPTVDAALSDVSLAQGQSWETSVALDGDGLHAIVLDYEGSEPRLLSGVAGAETLVPLRVVASGPRRLEATLRPAALDVRLVVRALNGAARPTRLVVRRWATGKTGAALATPTTPAKPSLPAGGTAERGSIAETPAPRRLEVGRDSSTLR